MGAYSFAERLLFSYSRIQETDIGTIMAMIPGCASVEKTGPEADKRGVDYIAHLTSGRELMIDAKTRSAGCRRYWESGEPELALERWSVMPGTGNCPAGKVGWTLNSAKSTDAVLFTFDRSDTPMAYLLPFQHLRKAFRDCGAEWLARYGPYAYQTTDGWYRGACLFVPANIVLDGVRAACIGVAV